MHVSEGSWIKVPIPDGAFPATISIDGREAQPAFIDRVVTDDGIVAMAALRCPQLRKGRHSATARAGTESYTVEFEVT